MNTFQNQYKFEPIGESRTNAFLFIYVSVFRVCPQFANPSVFYVMRYHQFRIRQRFLFCLSPYLFSKSKTRKTDTGFISVFVKIHLAAVFV